MHTFTVNWQPWYPNLDPPYVVAIVELPEQEGLRLTTNIVGCEPDDVAIGMAVRVAFEEYDGVWLPFFEPDRERSSTGPIGRPGSRPPIERSTGRQVERSARRSSRAWASRRSGGASTATRST